jgi:hypothetical protein
MDSWNLSALVWDGKQLSKENVSSGEMSVGKGSET